MNKRDLEILVKKGESDTVEFKSNFDNEAIIALTAFANTKGGKVIIGVSERGKAEGINIGKETIQRWVNEIKLKTNPSIIPDMEVSQCFGKNIVIFSLSEYPIKPVSFKGRCYKRVKNSNHIMSVNEVVNMHLKIFNSSWDYQIDNIHRLKDISLKKVDAFIKMANKNREIPIIDKPIPVLKKYELVRENRISQAAFLLFAKGLSLLSTIEAGRFQTETVIKDGIRIKADLFTEVEEALGFIKKHINKKYIITGKAQREERWDYPLDALREIVLNMIVHRDYSKSSDSIIKVFDNRIEFYNPGRLPDGLTIEKILEGDYVSDIRNKQIADIFKEAGIIEKYGSGITRIVESFKKHGLKQPRFEEIAEGFRVIVYNNFTAKSSPMSSPISSPKSSQKIIELIKENKNITIKNISECIGIGERAVKKQIHDLKKEGALQRIGSNRDGYWKVVLDK